MPRHPATLREAHPTWCSHPARSGLRFLLVTTALLIHSSLIGAATDLVVDSTDDTVASTSCTLRAAVIASNTRTATAGCPGGTGDDSITLASAASYVLTQIGDTTEGPSGLPSITGTVTIKGNGATVARSSASDTPLFRIFRVAPTGTLDLNDLTVANGSTPDNLGGGVFNAGTVTVRNTMVTNNESGVGGGGIYNTGTLYLIGSVVSGNAGAFGGGVFNDTVIDTEPSGTTYSPGELWVIATTVSGNTTGNGGDGGGILNDGVATIIDGIVTVNRTGDGHDLSPVGGLGGGGGSGGGIANGSLGSVPGTLTVMGSTISNNMTGNGGTGTTGGFGGDGGGIKNAYGAIVVNSTVISGNTTGGGGTGSVVGGIGGDGGGVANADVMTVVNCTIDGNSTGNGATGQADLGSRSGGSGGGIANALAGTMGIINSTISSNATGTGGCCGGFDSGGGIANAGRVSFASSTVSENTAGLNRAGGIANFSTGSLMTKNSLIAANSASDDPDCSGILTSDGYNLIGNTNGCTVMGNLAGNILGRDPMLGPLQNNGGSTPTVALLAGSSAIDAGDPAGCTNASGAVLTRDQRGAARARAGDTRCDIGSYEFDAVILPVCAGDCNQDGTVTIDELLTEVNIALGDLPPATCSALATNGSGTVTIDDILKAVDNALNGCS